MEEALALLSSDVLCRCCYGRAMATTENVLQNTLSHQGMTKRKQFSFYYTVNLVIAFVMWLAVVCGVQTQPNVVYTYDYVLDIYMCVCVILCVSVRCTSDFRLVIFPQYVMLQSGDYVMQSSVWPLLFIDCRSFHFNCYTFHSKEKEKPQTQRSLR